MTEIYSIPGFSDPFSAISHLLAAGVFLILSFPLLKNGWGNGYKFISLSVFCFSAIFLLSMSGVYHLLSHDGLGRIVLQRLDHSAIFILIVGSMTPVHQILFRGFMRWGWLILIWVIAITSLILKTIFFASFPEWLGVVVFLSLGWLGAVTGSIIWYKRDFSFIKLLLYGGLAYTIGALFELFQEPILIKGVIEAHELFHIAVVVGLSLHWRFIYNIARLDHSTINHQ